MRRPRTQPRGLDLGSWISILVIATFGVASIVWLGLNASRMPTATIEQQQALEAVQTPDEGGNAPAPAEQGGANVVRVPSFAQWAPGTLIQSTEDYPRPGESFTAQSCTVAFSFSNAEGRNFAVTAGHCGREGDLVWPTNAVTAQDYSREVGRFIYSGLYSQGAPDIDVGIIEITDPERYMDLVGAPIDTGVAEQLVAPTERICKTGGTTGYTCGQFQDSSRTQIITTGTEETRETRGDIAAVCAAKGDSGGPVFQEVDGRSVIIGVVSGTEAGRSGEECYEGMDNPRLMSYSNIEQTMQIVNAVVPDATWELRNW